MWQLHPHRQPHVAAQMSGKLHNLSTVHHRTRGGGADADNNDRDKHTPHCKTRVGNHGTTSGTVRTTLHPHRAHKASGDPCSVRAITTLFVTHPTPLYHAIHTEDILIQIERALTRHTKQTVRPTDARADLLDPWCDPKRTDWSRYALSATHGRLSTSLPNTLCWRGNGKPSGANCCEILVNF